MPQVSKPNSKKRASEKKLSGEPLNFEVGRAVDYLLAHRMDAVRELLRSVELPTSGSKRQLGKRVLRALADELLSPEQIISHLDQMEGWGNQHVTLFRSTETLAANWQDRLHVRDQLKKAGLESLFNSHRPIGLPEKPTLAQVLWNGCDRRSAVQHACERGW